MSDLTALVGLILAGISAVLMALVWLSSGGSHHQKKRGGDDHE